MANNQQDKNQTQKMSQDTQDQGKTAPVQQQKQAKPDATKETSPSSQMGRDAPPKERIDQDNAGKPTPPGKDDMDTETPHTARPGTQDRPAAR